MTYALTFLAGVAVAVLLLFVAGALEVAGLASEAERDREELEETGLNPRESQQVSP